MAHLRKGLLIAARHILATDLRNSEFVWQLLFVFLNGLNLKYPQRFEKSKILYVLLPNLKDKEYLSHDHGDFRESWTQGKASFILTDSLGFSEFQLTGFNFPYSHQWPFDWLFLCPRSERSAGGI